MKKRSIKTIIIILLVLTITITAPVGSYINSMTQSNQIAHADLMDKAVGFIKVMLLPMLAMSALKQSAMTVNEPITDYVQDKVEMFVQSSFTTAEMVQTLMKYPSLLYTLTFDRVDLLTEQEIDPYIEENLAYQSEYMGLTLEEKRIAMMEARMNLADGNITPKEVFMHQGMRDIAAKFINFFTNQLILDGYITEEAESLPDDEYPIWENYPQSHISITERPYQAIVFCRNNGLNEPTLITASAPFRNIISSIGNKLEPSMNIYRLVSGNWVHFLTASVMQYNTDKNIPTTNGIFESNNDIYLDETFQTIFFGKTTGGTTNTIDDFLDDTTKVPLYPITANPTYDPASANPDDHQPFVAPLPGIDTPTGDLTLSPGTVAPDGTITRDIEGVTETINNVDVQVDVRVDTATMEEILADIEANTNPGTNFRVPNLPNFLNLLLMILINIFKFIIGFLALVVAFRGIPATNYLLTDPNLIATINWWKTVNIPGFNLNLMQIITGFLVLMTIIRLLAILRSFIAKRAVYFSTEIEKDAIFEEWDANAKWGDPNSRQFAEYKADREVRKRKEKLGKPIEKYIRTNKQKLKR